MSSAVNGRPVGRVVGLWRYPVKSMGGEALPEAEVSWHGFAGDRRWAFIRDGVVRSGFPWLTLRERGDLAHYRPFFVEPARPDASPTMVRAPSGVTFDVVDPALAAELGPEVRVLKQDRGVFDPSAGSHHQRRRSPARRAGRRPARGRAVSPEHPGGGSRGRAVCRRRLGRLRAAHRGLRLRGRQAGRSLRGGHHRPATTERNPAILRTIVTDRQGSLGVYGSTVTPGRVAIRDPVVVDSPA